ncbi:MAG: N-acetylmuramoyl-L-alanine amidase [Alphaproteobacteria bacterium]|nr:N-acetylmuramoyl-L-alanine amidase [Alphaproteobacteria bacterium]
MTVQPRQAPSPNFDARRAGTAIDILMLHYTGMLNAEDALDRLRDPAAKVSAHYLIDEDGTVYAMVAEGDRAWHAGVSYWAGETDVNGRAIGIEIVNPGHDLGYRDFPDPQMTAVIALSQDILARHPIPPARVLGHSDVAPTRKQDPGERFDWARLAAAGIGLYPPDGLAPRDPPAPEAFRKNLARFGYGFDGDGAGWAAVTAFRRHFRPDHLSGPVDGTDAARLAWLLEAAAGG